MWHIGKREEASAFFFKIRLRVIHKKRKIEKRESKRERLYLLSRFSDDRTIGLRRSKRESPSS